MNFSKMKNLSRRERQIMELIYKNAKMTAFEVEEQLPDAPSYTTVRTLMRILEEKGHLKHTKSGRQYVYEPVSPPEKFKQHSLQHLLKTFFDGSITKAVATFIDHPDADLSEEDLAELEAIIKKAKKNK
ncbi:MAG: BlaI/MecI/CopY family transcriptional regulator [Bacteroidota bacterium]